MLPLVSVCIPTYNRPQPLAGVLAAIFRQTYPRVEVVVTDDGDSRKTIEAIRPFLDRIKYADNGGRLGIYGNWNRSIELSSGDLVAVYHDHDIYSPHVIEESVRPFTDHPRVGIVHTAVEMVWPDGSKSPIIHDLPPVARGTWFARRQALLFPSYVAHSAMMVRRDLYDRLGRFDESFGIAADMEMLIRVSLACDVAYVPKPLIGYRARVPGDALFDFKWSHTEDYARVRRLNVRRAFVGAPLAGAVAAARVEAQIDRRLLEQLAWCSIHRKQDLVEEGLGVVDRVGSRFARTAARLIAGRSPVADTGRQMAYSAYKALQVVRARLRAGPARRG